MKTEFQKCEICGKMFIPVGRHRYCEPCIAFMEKEKETHSRRGHKQVQKKISIQPLKTLDVCIKEANQLEITYGQYVERGYDKMMGVVSACGMC